jgi:apolipoprotein N-acyltransferase
MGDQKPTAAFVLSLLAGIFIIIGGGVRIVMGALMRRYLAFRGMMGRSLYASVERIRSWVPNEGDLGCVFRNHSYRCGFDALHSS